jgi:hypothetical protein
MRMPDDEDAPLRSKTSVLGVGSAEGYAAPLVMFRRGSVKPAMSKAGTQKSSDGGRFECGGPLAHI